jgi:hypothetical protein
MTDQNQAIRDDIAFMRALAEEGRQTPLLGGSMLVAVGLIFGVANAVGTYIEATQKTYSVAALAVPLGAVALFVVVLGWLKRRYGAQPGATSPVNRATGALWRAVGWSIVLMIAALGVVAARRHDASILAVLPIIIFALYGVGWQVAATMSKAGWLRLVALGSYVTALLAAYFVTEPVISSAVTTAGLFLLLAAPGFVLMRQAPSLIV